MELFPEGNVYFDQLDEVRSVARARAVEDFEFFANHVLGLRLDPQLCEVVQRGVEQGREVLPALLDASQGRKLESALHAWLVVLGRRQCSTAFSPTETFAWLFAEVAA